jgi:hypothetical protein
MKEMLMSTTQAAAPFGLTPQNLRPRRSPQSVDVLFIVDATGSSGPFARGITHIVPAAARGLAERIANARLGLIASRDQDIGERDETLLADGNAAAVQAAVGQLMFEGGGDADETHFWSVRDALRSYPWPEGPMRRKAMVLIGSSDSKSVPGTTLDQLVLDLLNRRMAVFVVAPPSANLRQLAELTDGLFFELSNEPSAAEVERLIGRLTASMTQTLSAAGTTAIADASSAAVAL